MLAHSFPRHLSDLSLFVHKPASIFLGAGLLTSVQGNAAYSVEVERLPSGHVWTFVVQSDGYKVFDKQGDRKPLNFLEIDTRAKRLIVHTAQNGLDTINPRLKMRQVMTECWTMTGLRPGDIREVKGTKIQNPDMLKALEKCRKGMDLGTRSDFRVTAADKNAAEKACWRRLGRTIFSLSIKGAIKDFDVRKELVQFEVKNSWQGDDIYYYLDEM
ncbi:hypothetical protein CDEST_11479 [Colletotrichum destructivum]|uniref:DUF4412 domain-containing protein n=1 Tax=Colletotrichum destructivum TaxID=34406 RepID=A0AAX4ITD5_9PEZI|nr:hypothetical protein CDEST_11479 [Colletotrichum destructivum]